MDRLPLKVLLPELSEREAVLKYKQEFQDRHEQLTSKTVTNELELEMLQVALDWIERLSRND